MKVLICILSELSHETRLERMATSLRMRGHQVSVSWCDNGEFSRAPYWDDVVHHRLINPRAGRRKLYFLRFMKQVYELIREQRPDAVLAIDPPALLPAALLKKQMGFHLVYDSREYYTELPTIRQRKAVREFWRLAESYAIPRCDAAMVVAPRIASALASDYECDAPRVVRNTPARSSEDLHSRESRQMSKQNLLKRYPQLKTAKQIVLYQGGFWPGYDFEALFRAMAELEDVHLLALGDGPTLKRHRRIAAGLSHGARLHLPGKVPAAELAAISRGADLGTILVPDLGRSYRYLLPNKLFEYIQAGLPVLASPLPELADVIQESRIGVLADPEDPVSIAAGLKTLCDKKWLDQHQQDLALARDRWCWQREEEAFLDCFA